MLLDENQLEVKTSTIPNSGKGLFTKTDIPKDTRIVEYTGRISSWKDADHQDGNNPYIFYINKNHVIDGSSDPDSLGRYANDARGLTKIKGITNNAIFEKDKLRVYIKAAKKIKAGSEIFVGYGKDYWDTVRKNMAIDAAATKKTKTAGKKKKKK